MSQSVDFSQTHVLVVDDEKFMREMVCRVLRMIGVTKISEATDGTDGLTKLAVDPPDLIILDIMMEPMNGLKFLKMVRIGLSDAARDLPVIVLTGSDEQSIFGTAMALDCNAFVRKADSLDTLRDRMARVLAEALEVSSSGVYQSVKIPDLIKLTPAAERPQDAASPPAKAYEIPIEEVEAGAVVAQDVTTDDGSILLAAGSVLSGANLNRLRDISEIIDLPSLWVIP